MKLPPWDRDKQAWDRFGAFHLLIGQFEVEPFKSWHDHPMVLFDTGEAIFTDTAPGPNKRGTYRPLGLEVTTSKNITGPLYAPDGQKIAVAWLYDGGQESLLVDEDTHRVVRIRDSYRRKPEDLIAGVPHRFQNRCTAYVPGPGMPPIGMDKIIAWLPFKAAGLTDDEKAHIQMITDTTRAALKLIDHEVTQQYASAPNIYSGCSLDKVLAAQTWQDFEDADLHALFHYGAQRKRIEYDYLLTEKP
jgi:hypothetical protein